MTRKESSGYFEKLEFWALTAVFVVCLPMFLDGDPGLIVRYITVFVTLLYVNFRVAPQLFNRESITKNVLILFAILIAFGFVYLLPSIFIPYKPDIGLAFEYSLTIGLIIAGHVIIKRLALYIISKSDTLHAFFLVFNRDNLTAFGLWMIVTYWIMIIWVPVEVRLAWSTIVPTAILLHGIAFHYFIPASLRWKYPLISYFLMILAFCVLVGNASSILLMVITTDEERSFTVGAFNGIGNALFTAPALWLIYRWQMRGKEQIYALQSELGRSAANLDFLRSQINPHFLFNALNTIYGLAIQEKAERTSASVQKLGDMMRFMLSENTQERISLTRELEYLDNYISLQKLRTDGNADLTIQVDIPQEIEPAASVAPMLLIPFVENAFKHGISLREHSYIKIYLELKNRTLYFDVHNSTHRKVDNDPEKHSNGIGLQNVRERLQHMYPKRHELLVRETAREFFVHLMIELD